MRLVTVKRKTKKEKRFSEKMGMFTANVTYVKKRFMSIPYRTVHKYRETYYGKVKDCVDCQISA